MLTNKDLSDVFSSRRGVEDEQIAFWQVYIDPTIRVKKGLFAFVIGEDESQSLKNAIYNGAIGAIWPKHIPLPHFVPNHFPVFLVNDTLYALKQLTEYYIKSVEGNRYKKMTKILLSNMNEHNVKNFTYDNNAMFEELTYLVKKLDELAKGEGRE